jgi:hypothetical protein
MRAADRRGCYCSARVATAQAARHEMSMVWPVAFAHREGQVDCVSQLGLCAGTTDRWKIAQKGIVGTSCATAQRRARCYGQTSQLQRQGGRRSGREWPSESNRPSSTISPHTGGLVERIVCDQNAKSTGGAVVNPLVGSAGSGACW